MTVPASHGLRSTNWNSAEAGSKREARISTITRSISVTHNATQRALRLTAASSPGSTMMNSAPSSGRNVMTESIGQLAMSVASAREHEPGDERRRSDHHREGVMVEVAGLQAHHIAGDVDHARRHAIWPEAVSQLVVNAAAHHAEHAPRRRRDLEDTDLVRVTLVDPERV